MALSAFSPNLRYRPPCDTVLAACNSTKDCRARYLPRHLGNRNVWYFTITTTPDNFPSEIFPRQTRLPPLQPYIVRQESCRVIPPSEYCLFSLPPPPPFDLRSLFVCLSYPSRRGRSYVNRISGDPADEQYEGRLFEHTYARKGGGSIKVE